MPYIQLMGAGAHAHLTDSQALNAVHICVVGREGSGEQCEAVLRMLLQRSQQVHIDIGIGIDIDILILILILILSKVSSIVIFNWRDTRALTFENFL